MESVIAQIPEEINLLDDDESEDASDATDKEVVQFHFLSSINCGSASFLTPDDGFFVWILESLFIRLLCTIST